MGGLFAYVDPSRLTEFRARSCIGYDAAVLGLGGGREPCALWKPANGLRSFQNASISPSSLRFSPRRTGNRPPCLPARLFLGILAVCAPDSRLRRQPTDHKTLFIPFFPYFSSFVWVRLGPGVRGRGGGDTGTGAGTGAGTSAGTGERCSAILNSVSWSVAAQLMQL